MTSIERAVVLYVDEDADPAAGRLCGRVEHVVSGRAGRFESLAELLALLGRTLTAAEADRER